MIVTEDNKVTGDENISKNTTQQSAPTQFKMLSKREF